VCGLHANPFIGFGRDPSADDATTGNATVCGPSFSMTANSSSPVYGAVDIGFQSILRNYQPLRIHALI
jgi:hypothetical protein